MIIEGRRYTLITYSYSAIGSEVDQSEGRITLLLTLSDPSTFKPFTYRFDYELDKIKKEIDIEKMLESNEEITAVAFGLFLMDKNGFGSMSVSRRKAIYWLIKSYINEFKISLKVNGVLMNFSGEKIEFEANHTVYPKADITHLTKCFYERISA